MAGRVNEMSISGARMYVSAQLPATYDQAGYEASAVSSSLVEIGYVENFGNHGVKANIIRATPVATAEVHKIKGSKDYGSMDLAILSIPSDVGQTLLRAAAESQNHYSVRFDYPDGEVHHLDTLIGSFEYRDGGADDIMRIGVMLEICKKPVVVAAP
jgi:hypothetical protein